MYISLYNFFGIYVNSSFDYMDGVNSIIAEAFDCWPADPLSTDNDWNRGRAGYICRRQDPALRFLDWNLLARIQHCLLRAHYRFSRFQPGSPGMDIRTPPDAFQNSFEFIQICGSIPGWYHQDQILRIIEFTVNAVCFQDLRQLFTAVTICGCIYRDFQYFRPSQAISGFLELLFQKRKHFDQRYPPLTNWSEQDCVLQNTLVYRLYRWSWGLSLI